MPSTAWVVADRCRSPYEGQRVWIILEQNWLIELQMIRVEGTRLILVVGLFRRGAKSGASGRNVECAPLTIFGSELKIARPLGLLFLPPSKTCLNILPIYHSVTSWSRSGYHISFDRGHLELSKQAKKLLFQWIQRFTKWCTPGLVKFVSANAYLLCLALPRSFLSMFCTPFCKPLGKLTGFHHTEVHTQVHKLDLGRARYRVTHQEG